MRDTYQNGLHGIMIDSSIPNLHWWHRIAWSLPAESQSAGYKSYLSQISLCGGVEAPNLVRQLVYLAMAIGYSTESSLSLSRSVLIKAQHERSAGETTSQACSTVHI